MGFEPGLRDRLRTAIAAAEERTDAELTLALARASGSYRDADHLAATVAAVVVAAALLFVHRQWDDFSDDWLVPPVALVYALVVWLSSRTFFLRRLFTTEARRQAQVRHAARAAFVEEKVFATRCRVGLLFYFSALERSFAVLPDHGIEGRVESATWHGIAREGERAARADSLEPAVVAALARASELLAAKVPRSADAGDRLPDRVRVRA